MATPNQLTPEQLKKFKGLENLTDSEAEYFCEQVNQYAAILLMAFPFEETKKIVTDKQKKNENGRKHL